MKSYPGGLSDQQRDAILLVLLKRMRKDMKPAEKTAILCPDDDIAVQIARLLEDTMAEKDRKRQALPRIRD